METLLQDRINMHLVVDSNVVISAVLNKGNILDIFIKNFLEKRLDFIAPNFLILEIGKHTEKIGKMTKFSSEEVLEMLEFVVGQITFVSDEYFKDKIGEARTILKNHEKDVPYLALSLAFNCKIFSGDKVLKSIIPSNVKSPQEILDSFDD